MQVTNGDIVRMRDGRIVRVTDAADQNPDAYRHYRTEAKVEDGKIVMYDVLVSENPVETIFVGEDANGRTVVSDMSEVVATATM